MKRSVFLPVVVPACINGLAKQPSVALDFRPIAGSATAIGGHTFRN